MRYLLIAVLFTLSSACGQTVPPVSPADTAHHQVTALNRAAAAHHLKGNKAMALKYHNEALHKARKHGLHEDQVRSLIGIAHVLKTEDADESIVHLKKALHLADSIGHQQLSSEIYRSLSEVYRQQANYEQALHALEEHHRLAEKMMQQDKQQKIALLEKTYQRNWILVVTLSVLLILAILIYYLRKTQTLNKQLNAANQIKDKLFTIIGHDLRNPISSITNVLSLMEHDELTADEQREMIGQMRRQGDVSLEILNSLLNWGTAQLNGITIHPVVFQPSGIIDSNITALQGKALEKKLTVQNHVPADLRLKADRDHFNFIIRNLLSNAIKFSRDGGKIEIDAQSQAGKLVFSVKDEGIGINEAQQKAFLSRHMEIAYGTKGEKGTGIGLMLSKEFLKAGGGAIWLESRLGEGTIFYFNLPSQPEDGKQ